MNQERNQNNIPLNSRYKVNEIFYSIQGEGLYAGTPTIFIRFAGCNLKCSFCDTDHASYHLLTDIEIASTIYKMIQAHNIPNGVSSPMICLTGGEPLLQVDKPLLRRLNYILPVAIETNGLLLNAGYLIDGSIPLFKHITISPKTLVTDIPQDVLKFIMNYRNRISIKIVWDDRNPALIELIEQWSVCLSTARFLQPKTNPTGTTNADKVITYIKSNPEWRLSLQTHRLLNIK